MINTVPDILTRIVHQKKAELAEKSIDWEALEERAEQGVQSRRDFAGALRSKAPAVIAEIKKASPSKGLLTGDFRPENLAREYQEGGAAALSVLTDERFFQGSLEHLRAARSAVKLPTLRKDFTTDPYHVLEAAACGADAILLIAAILTEQEMRNLREMAGRYRMAALVEVHDGEEVRSALASGAEIIGVNNRNLNSFEVALDTSFKLAEQLPEPVLKVSESGIETREQINRLQAAGYQAFLIGEHLMRSQRPAEALRALTA